ncbi:DUF4840 domain-containing protein [Duncaniella muricolitica]|jgi:hypothetical protein|uniref:DUF4840 domain-containing protein n=1 Tax=Duncaniella muricolitica TaxID=2880704 RepID=UPI000F4AD9A6|nr:DUF4840 domain-containing protein [Duncaniella muricolitica]ROT21231.1 DUF4840 domain-containing protein [Muribaculaceae bacterium Isolate-110 (HZI)]
MKQIATIILFIALVFISSCNKDEPEFSSSEIQRALFEMKGTYHGEMRASYYHGNTISVGNACKVVSKDSLTVNMDLSLMAMSITDEIIASRLRDIGVVQVKAAYEFYQMDEQMYHFVLLPKNVICPGDSDLETVKIVFDQIFGGSADPFYHSIMFNLSPKELWLGDKKYEPFQQLVYHFEGTCE